MPLPTVAVFLPSFPISVQHSAEITIPKYLHFKNTSPTASEPVEPESRKNNLPNHLIFGSTLATVPGATVD